MFEPSSKFDGPSAVIETWSESGDAELGPTASVSIGASVGTTSSDDSAAVIEWTDDEGDKLRVFGAGLAVDTVVEIARTVSIHNGRAAFAELPGGLVAAEATLVETGGNGDMKWNRRSANHQVTRTTHHRVTPEIPRR